MTALTIESTADDHRIAQLAALAISLMWLEASLPSPIPGVKPGLANIVILLVLRQYGLATAAWVSGLRVIAGSLLLGSFLTPGFVLSCAGAASSLAVLALVGRFSARWISLVGISVLAAFAHIGAQLAVVSWWMMPGVNVWASSPVFATAAWLGGLVNGVLAEQWLRKVKHVPTT
uniref:Heptaprenyl diphosphate synthase component I n=1 Tax=mine drainage metagenome TaxID=410659 RepID=E6QSG2_9ZZZZ